MPQPTFDASTLSFDERGLIPVITQDAQSGEILMLAYANQEALELSLGTGKAHYYSRSRQSLWLKGESSGHTQHIQDIRYDCDGDSLLYKVIQTGVACHTGERSCFYRSLEPDKSAPPNIGEMLALLERTVQSRLQELPEGSYISKMNRKGLGYMAQKVVEEAGETIVAALEHNTEELKEEAADLLFHLNVLLAKEGLSLQDVADVLATRHGEKS